jgi:hypothetical protein
MSTTTQTTATPTERMRDAHAAYIAWQAPAGLSDLERAQARADRHGTTVAALVGWLRGLAATGALTPEKLALAVEDALTFGAASPAAAAAQRLGVAS